MPKPSRPHTCTAPTHPHTPTHPPAPAPRTAPPTHPISPLKPPPYIDRVPRPHTRRYGRKPNLRLHAASRRAPVTHANIHSTRRCSSAATCASSTPRWRDGPPRLNTSHRGTIITRCALRPVPWPHHAGLRCVAVGPGDRPNHASPDTPCRGARLSPRAPP
jgi:hypothetical protein